MSEGPYLPMVALYLNIVMLGIRIVLLWELLCLRTSCGPALCACLSLSASEKDALFINTRQEKQTQMPWCHGHPWWEGDVVVGRTDHTHMLILLTKLRTLLSLQVLCLALQDC